MNAYNWTKNVVYIHALWQKFKKWLDIQIWAQKVTLNFVAHSRTVNFAASTSRIGWIDHLWIKLVIHDLNRSFTTWIYDLIILDCLFWTAHNHTDTVHIINSRHKWSIQFSYMIDSSRTWSIQVVHDRFKSYMIDSSRAWSID